MATSSGRCRVVGSDKPQVWRDDEGWVCDQTTVCLKCGSMNFERLAEETSWAEAMEASRGARPIGDKA